MHLIQEPMFLTFLLCKGRGVSYWLQWGDFRNITIGYFGACLTHMRYPLKPWSWGLRPHDQRFAKTTACRHVNVEIWTFLDAHPSITSYKFLFRKTSLTNFEVFRNITIGHFGACLTHMWYSLKPWSWGLRPHDQRFAKMTACRHFNVEILTFLDAVPSVTAYKLLACFSHPYFFRILQNFKIVQKL